MPVSVMRLAKFSYTSQLCLDFVVTMNRFGWMASKLSSRIIRATFLRFTCTPRRFCGDPPIAVATTMFQSDLLNQ